jgi:hypothetical protein
VRFVIAQRAMSLPGGSETFVLTIAEHLASLGHEVVVWALQLGLAAQIGRERAIDIVGDIRKLPSQTDATIALERTMAIDLALRYPRATRLFAMHNANEVWRPPPEPGIVAATLVANDRMAALARGCSGAGEVVRIRQPIDLRRFSPQGRWQPREKPSNVLLIGNYFDSPAQRVDQLKKAWAQAGLKWRQVGNPTPTALVAEEMADADIVVGYGRSILEAMACGRAAYAHEHCGSDGWVTAATYERMEADGFSGAALRLTPSLDTLRKDLSLYDPALGQVGRDLARHHDARFVAAEVASLAARLGGCGPAHDPLALTGLRNLTESRLRADLDIARLRDELRSRPPRSRFKRNVARILSQALESANLPIAVALAGFKSWARRGWAVSADLLHKWS